MADFPTLDTSMFGDDVAGSDNVARANCLLNAFRVAVNNSLAVFNMVDGVLDEFEDETGVDGTASTDETYDASGDYYHNPGGTSGDLLAGQTYTSTNVYQGALANVFDGNAYTDLRWYDAWPDWIRVQLSEAKTLTSFRFATGTLDLGKVNGWRVYGSNDGSSWSSQLAQGDCPLGPPANTWYGPFDFDTTGSYLYYKFELITASNSNSAVAALQAYETLASPDMVLVSETSVAEDAPDEALFVVWQEDVDSVTLNTDLIAYVTRDADAGTPEWTQVTLTEEATLGTGRILTGSVDISGAASDVDMAWKLVVANNKEQRIHGVGLSWS